MIFREEDWNRLKKIGLLLLSMVLFKLKLWHLAEGNPDEEKIGAFGVGRYQLTAVLSALTT